MAGKRTDTSRSTENRPAKLARRDSGIDVSDTMMAEATSNRSPMPLSLEVELIHWRSWYRDMVRYHHGRITLIPAEHDFRIVINPNDANPTKRYVKAWLADEAAIVGSNYFGIEMIVAGYPVLLEIIDWYLQRISGIRQQLQALVQSSCEVAALPQGITGSLIAEDGNMKEVMEQCEQDLSDLRQVEASVEGQPSSG